MKALASGLFVYVALVTVGVVGGRLANVAIEPTGYAFMLGIGALLGAFAAGAVLNREDSEAERRHKITMRSMKEDA